MQLLNQLSHEIICTFEFNHIHMLMRLSTPLNSTTFIHMLLLFIVMFSGFLPNKPLHFERDLVWIFFTIELPNFHVHFHPLYQTCSWTFFFWLRRRQLGFPKNEIYQAFEITSILFGQALLPQGTFSSVYRCDIWPAWLVTQPLPNVYNGELI